MKAVVATVLFLVVMAVPASAEISSTNLTDPTFYYQGAHQSWEMVKSTREAAAGWIDRSVVGDFTIGNFLTWLAVIALACVGFFLLLKHWALLLAAILIFIMFLIVVVMFGLVLPF